LWARARFVAVRALAVAHRGIHSAIETRAMQALYYGRPLRFYTV
jgi:hypothetical protein